jgi:hypothetical protein
MWMRSSSGRDGCSGRTRIGVVTVTQLASAAEAGCTPINGSGQLHLHPAPRGHGRRKLVPGQRGADNCDGTVPDPFSLSVSVRSSTEVRLESGAFFNVSGTPSLLDAIDATATSVKNRFKILGFREESSVTVTIRADVEPGQRAAIYFRPEVVESGGYLEAEYKEAQDGTKVFFPEQNADTVLVRFPLANDNGDPKGFYWIRSVPCLENSRLVIPGFNTADFGELDGAFGVTDTPVATG